MATATETYRTTLARLAAQFEQTSDEFRLGRIEARKQHEVDLLKESGDPRAIWRVQRVYADGYWNAARSRYRGETDDNGYHRDRVGLTVKYFESLRDLGFLTVDTLPTWVLRYTQEAREFEETLIAGKTDAELRAIESSDAELAILCIPLRDYSKQFFERLHREAGIPTLSAKPDIFGGVDSVCKELES